jgi:hypothetical protein
MAQQKVRHPVEFITFDDSLRADQLENYRLHKPRIEFLNHR